jgi:hypothetical protein
MEIEPKEFVTKKIMKVINKENVLKNFKIKPEIDFPILLDDMKKEALKKGYIYFE